MLAKDTVMKPGDLCRKVCLDYRTLTLAAKDCTGLDCEDCQLEAQAEIALKAAMKEVVESGIRVDIDTKGSIPHFHYAGTNKGMVGYDLAEKANGESGVLVFIRQAKLKEWGLD